MTNKALLVCQLAGWAAGVTFIVTFLVFGAAELRLPKGSRLRLRSTLLHASALGVLSWFLYAWLISHAIVG